MNKIASEERVTKGEQLDPDVVNILGEVLWHTATLDASIEQVSQAHLHEIVKYAKCHFPNVERKQVRFLEVAAYAHITGYLLAQQHGWNITLSDISVETLAIGERQAQLSGLSSDQVRRIASDFHDLPFPDGAFEIVYIASALHHTLRWKTVLNELRRVTAPGGILILQNEPCRRHFCFYKFPTNRPDRYRPIETELLRLGIINTIAEPFPGSRPETLFGMIENQQMPLPEILRILRSEGTVEYLNINSLSCMSEFDTEILTTMRTTGSAAYTLRRELLARLESAQKTITSTDTAMGYRLPSQSEVADMAESMARLLETLPERGSTEYEIAVADLFGGSLTAVMRKSARTLSAVQPDRLRFANGERKGVVRAAEHGRWVGIHHKPAGIARPYGSYFVHWSKATGHWRVVSEAYVTLGCRGPGC